MTRLNPLQQAMLDFISEEHLPFLHRLSQLDRPEVKTLFDHLGTLILGDTQSCQKITAILPQFKQSPILGQFSLEGQGFLNDFLKRIESITTAINAKPLAFPRLTDKQQLAICLLFQQATFKFEKIYFQTYKNTNALELINTLKDLALGRDKRFQLFRQIFQMLKGLGNNPLDNKQNHDFLHGRLNYISEIFFKPSLLNRIAGVLLGMLLFGIVFPIAHNPIYHFIHLFRSRKSKTFHLRHIAISLISPLLGIIGGCEYGYNYGVEGVLHRLAFVAGKHYIGLTLISLLIISAAIAATLLTLFFPPLAPLLLAYIPLLIGLSPTLLAIVTGVATGIILTTVTALATMSYALIKDYQQASIKPTIPAASTLRLPITVISKDMNAQPVIDDTAQQALGNKAAYTPPLTPAVNDDTSIHPLVFQVPAGQATLRHIT
jgi:hypothetical protein